MVLLAGMISNSSVLANAYRVVDEKMVRCMPCEPKVVKRGKTMRGKSGLAKKTGK